MHFAAGGGVLSGCRDQQRADLAAWLRVRRLEGRPFIAVQMGNKRTMRRGLRRLAVNSKYWPKARWAEVLRHVRRRHPRHALVLLGTGPSMDSISKLLPWQASTQYITWRTICR